MKSVNPVSERVTALESDVKDLTAELKTLQIQVQEVLAKLVQVHQSHSEVSSQVLQELAKLNYGQGKTNVPVKKEEPKEPPRSKTPEEILESANLNSKVLKLIIKNAKVGQPAAVWSKAFCKKLHSTGDPAYTRLTAELCLELLQASGALDGDGNVQEADQ
ncbi:MAG: hypothetical protein E6R03_06620 [Hyphomicrobiaceae bacterium]|nr:MAG: hypothetical protein E6R03_06620 [Hyphomicrobiaceae bacterium]